MSKTANEKEPYNIADHALKRDAAVLLCEEHKLVQRFTAGTLWREVYAAKDAHEREEHQ